MCIEADVKYCLLGKYRQAFIQEMCKSFNLLMTLKSFPENADRNNWPGMFVVFGGDFQVACSLANERIKLCTVTGCSQYSV